MAYLVSITPLSPTQAVATFSAAMDPATLVGGSAWASVSATGALPCHVTDSEPVEGSPESAYICVGPALAPGHLFTIVAADTVLDALGNTLTLGDRTQTFTSLSEMLSNPRESYTVWAACTEAAAECAQDLAGSPTTLAVSSPTAPFSEWFVESTLGFPDVGSFFCGGRRFSYTGTGEVSFTGVSLDTGEPPLNGNSPPAFVRDVIILDPRSVVPVE